MDYPGIMLTDLGKDTLAKGLQGKTIHFSKVALGSGDFDYDTEKVADLTALRQWEMDLPIVGKEIEGNGLVLIKALLNNFDLAKGFPAKEVGIFALDPDSGDELLYAYGNLGNEYTYIPSNSGAVHKNIIFGYRVTIHDAPNVTFNINFDFAYVSQQEFEDHLNSENPHPNFPNRLDDIDFTDNFWATDFDNNLHRISIQNSKKILLRDLEKNFAVEKKMQGDFNDFFVFKEMIGLEPNIFIIEKFDPPTTIDFTEIEITSAAKNGNLLGVPSLDGLHCGDQLFLSDGLNRQSVTVTNLVSGTPDYVEISPNVAFDFDLQSLKLFRSALQAANTDSKVWDDNFNFSGISANTKHWLTLSL